MSPFTTAAIDRTLPLVGVAETKIRGRILDKNEKSDDEELKLFVGGSGLWWVVL